MNEDLVIEGQVDTESDESDWEFTSSKTSNHKQVRTPDKVMNTKVEKKRFFIQPTNNGQTQKSINHSSNAYNNTPQYLTYDMPVIDLSDDSFSTTETGHKTSNMCSEERNNNDWDSLLNDKQAKVFLDFIKSDIIDKDGKHGKLKHYLQTNMSETMLTDLLCRYILKEGESLKYDKNLQIDRNSMVNIHGMIKKPVALLMNNVCRFSCFGRIANKPNLSSNSTSFSLSAIPKKQNKLNEEDLIATIQNKKRNLANYPNLSVPINSKFVKENNAPNPFNYPPYFYYMPSGSQAGILNLNLGDSTYNTITTNYNHTKVVSNQPEQKPVKRVLFKTIIDENPRSKSTSPVKEGNISPIKKSQLIPRKEASKASPHKPELLQSKRQREKIVIEEIDSLPFSPKIHEKDMFTEMLGTPVFNSEDNRIYDEGSFRVDNYANFDGDKGMTDDDVMNFNNSVDRPLTDNFSFTQEAINEKTISNVKNNFHRDLLEFPIEKKSNKILKNFTNANQTTKTNQRLPTKPERIKSPQSVIKPYNHVNPNLMRVLDNSPQKNGRYSIKPKDIEAEKMMIPLLKKIYRRKNIEQIKQFVSHETYNLLVRCFITKPPEMLREKEVSVNLTKSLTLIFYPNTLNFKVIRTQD